MNLVGKSREQIGRALAGLTMEQLVDVVYALATVEPHYSPGHIALLSGMSRQVVLKDMKAGKFGGGYYLRSPNLMRVGAADVLAWRRNFWVSSTSIAAHKKRADGDQNGLNGENAGQKTRSGSGGRSDVESDALVSRSEVMDRPETDLMTDRERFEGDSATRQEGGRGSSSERGVAQNQNGEASRNFISKGALVS